MTLPKSLIGRRLKAKDVLQITNGSFLSEKSKVPVIKPRKKYKPSPPSPEQSVLLTSFQKWSGNRHPLASVEEATQTGYKPIDGLESNLYAQMLMEPVRQDRFSRVRLPASLLLPLSLDKGTLVPAESASYKNLKRANSYISLSKKSVKMLQKSFPNIIYHMRKNIKSLAPTKSSLGQEFNDYAAFLARMAESTENGQNSESRESFRLKVYRDSEQ